MAQILIVEDEPKIADLLQKYLQNANYQTHWLNTGLGVGDWVRKEQPQLILLDLMLPGKDGLEVCKEVRQFSPVPIIMLTARVEEIDRLLGLELGADDYICKPFSPREVVARVKAVLRRLQAFMPTEHNGRCTICGNCLRWQHATGHFDTFCHSGRQPAATTATRRGSSPNQLNGHRNH